MKTTLQMVLLLAGMCALSACDPNESASNSIDDHAEEPAAAPTNRVDIPPAVRQNLGITFVEVEARRVAQTLRVPGRFEYLPTARREYRTMLPGRVELLVEQFEEVELDDPLYRIDSPGWREMQQNIADAEAAIERHTARLASFDPLLEAHERHEKQIEETISILQERVDQIESLAQAGGGRVAELNEARSAVATAQSTLAELGEKHAQLDADRSETRAQLTAGQSKRKFLLDSAASLLRTNVESLLADVDGTPHWRTIDEILVRAENPGVVESLGLTNGAWADTKSTVLTVVQPDRLRFRAIGLQSDLSRLRNGLPARIVAPSPTRAGGAIDLSDTMAGELQLGLTGNPDDRTVVVYVTPQMLQSWARAGVSAQLEIVTDQTARPALAIPKAAVQRDGLAPIIFRRDPDDPNKAIRIEADLGLDDGRWVVVNSGLRRGDEVVLDGAFQLMLATSTGGQQQQGGHFHADGTFHADEDH